MTFLRRFRKLARERKQKEAMKVAGFTPVRIKECKWPIGDVGKPNFHFCCAEAIPGRSPYCAEHTKIAYRRPPSEQSHGQRALIKALKV